VSEPPARVLELPARVLELPARVSELPARVLQLPARERRLTPGPGSYDTGAGSLEGRRGSTFPGKRGDPAREGVRERLAIEYPSPTASRGIRQERPRAAVRLGARAVGSRVLTRASSRGRRSRMGSRERRRKDGVRGWALGRLSTMTRFANGQRGAPLRSRACEDDLPGARRRGRRSRSRGRSGRRRWPASITRTPTAHPGPPA
jgi:hypothetical protein